MRASRPQPRATHASCVRGASIASDCGRDAWANRNRIPIEEQKSETERGFYLHPEAFDQPEERGASWAHEPEQMRQDKERRLEAQAVGQPPE